MIKHYIKLMWKRKRKNTLMLVELTISFIVLFAISSLLIYNYSNYYKDMGYEYDNVWLISFDWEDEENESVVEKMNSIKTYLINKKEIENASLINSIFPFSFSLVTSAFDDVQAHYGVCEKEYVEVLNMSIIQGRNFNESDKISKLRPMLINQRIVEDHFPNTNPLGHVFDDEYIVVGVFDNYRYASSYMSDDKVVFLYYNLNDTSRREILNHMLIKVNEGTNRRYEANLTKELMNHTGTWKIDITRLEDDREARDKAKKIPVTIFFFISAFLIINVALGIFGLIWYNINKRKAEIGLRRALGANVKDITNQISYEILILAFFSIIIGLFIAVQFPMFAVFNVEPIIYTSAIIFSIVFLTGLLYVCTIFPGRQAAQIQPAEALHDE